MFSYRFFSLLLLLPALIGCGPSDVLRQKKLVIGAVSYGKGNLSFDRYAGLKTQIESQLKCIIEIEPAYNEVQALQQIERKAWDVVFAPAGLAAIAIAEAKYLPVLPRSGGGQDRSIIVVKEESSIRRLGDLANQTVALGQVGSATGYYYPLFNLYGSTLAEVKLAPTPKTMLEWIAQGKVAAGALSVAELEQYRAGFPNTKFRVLYRDTHLVPSGSILVGPNVERNEQEQILKALQSVPSSIAASADYVSNAKPPDYKYLIEVVKRVRPIAKRIKEKPAPLY
jgi:phosphonate transport system substrate-binding protein